MKHFALFLFLFFQFHSPFLAHAATLEDPLDQPFRQTPEFLDIQQKAKKEIRRSTFREKALQAAIGSTVVASYLGYQWFYAPTETDFSLQTELGGMWTNMWGQACNPYMFAAVAGGLVKEKLADCYNWALGKKNKSEDEQSAVEYRLFAEQSRELPPAFKEKILSELVRLDRIFAFAHMEPYDEMNIKNTLLAISYILRLPYQKKNFGDLLDKNNPDLLRLQANFKKVKENYPLSIQRQLDTLLTKIVSTDETSQRAIVYMLGSPGTGKTRLAEMIADALEVPFIKLSACETAEKLFGGGIHSDLSNFDPKHLSTFTRLLTTSTNKKGKKSKRAVIFFDEIDKPLKGADYNAQQLKEKFLLLLEASRKNHILPEFGIEYDLSDSIFILAGNEKVDLMSRTEIFAFPPFEKEEKQAIALAQFRKKIAEKKSAYPTFTVTKAQQNQVKDIIAADQNPGVRVVLSVLDMYVNFLFQEQSPILSTGQPFDIQQAFEAYDNSDRSQPAEEPEPASRKRKRQGADTSRKR